MGLICNIFIGVTHLLFVAMDIIFVMIAVKVIYDRWRPDCLKQVLDAVEPIVDYMSKYVGSMSLKVTGKVYSQRTLLLLIIICLSVARLIIAGLL